MQNQRCLEILTQCQRFIILFHIISNKRYLKIAFAFRTFSSFYYNFLAPSQVTPFRTQFNSFIRTYDSLYPLTGNTNTFLSFKICLPFFIFDNSFTFPVTNYFPLLPALFYMFKSLYILLPRLSCRYGLTEHCRNSRFLAIRQF